MEPFHISILQSRYQSVTDLCFFSYSLYSIYCFSFSYIQKNLSIPIPISLLSFVNDGPFISQEKSYKKSNTILYYSYSIASSLFNQFSLVIRHDKPEDFHFLRITKKTELPLLDLRLFDITFVTMLTKHYLLSRT